MVNNILLMKQSARTQVLKRKQRRCRISAPRMKKVPKVLPYDPKKMNHIGSKFRMFLILGRNLLGKTHKQFADVATRVDTQDSLTAIVALLVKNSVFARKMQLLERNGTLQRRLDQYLYQFNEKVQKENKKIVQTFYPVFVKFLYCYKEKRNQKYLSWVAELKTIKEEERQQQAQQPILIQDSQVSEQVEDLVQNNPDYAQPIHNSEVINREPEIKKDVPSTADIDNVQTEMVVEESGCGWQQMQSEESSCQRAIRENWRDVQKKINDKGQDDKDFENYMSRPQWEEI